MNSRLLLILALSVAVFLPLSYLVAPDLYIEPTTTERYAITHESTVAFDATIEETDLETSDATPVTRLSSTAQRGFDEMLNERPDDHEGWYDTEIVVCSDPSLVCSAYDESLRTEFPSDAYEPPDGPTSTTYSLLEADGERYIVETKYGYGLVGFGALFVLLLEFVGLVLYGLYLAILALTRRETHPYSVLGCSGCGLIVLALPHVYTALGTGGGSVIILYVLALLVVGSVGSGLGILVSNLLRRRSGVGDA